MVQLGAALDRYGDVNLDHPDVTVFVEARDGEALFFSDHVAGAGGLPLGAEGRAVCLFSGGFDSPVAAWLLLKRGVALDYVFCNLGGEAYERSVVSVAKILADRWSHGYRPVLHAIDFTRPLEELRRAVEPRYRQVVLKRLMYRAAEAVARELRAPSGRAWRWASAASRRGPARGATGGRAARPAASSRTRSRPTSRTAASSSSARTRRTARPGTGPGRSGGMGGASPSAGKRS